MAAAPKPNFSCWSCSTQSPTGVAPSPPPERHLLQSLLPGKLHLRRLTKSFIPSQSSSSSIYPVVPSQPKQREHRFVKLSQRDSVTPQGHLDLHKPRQP